MLPFNLLLYFIVINSVEFTEGQDDLTSGAYKISWAVIYWELHPGVKDPSLNDKTLLCKEPVMTASVISCGPHNNYYPANTAECLIYCQGQRWRISVQCWAGTDGIHKWYATELPPCVIDSTGASNNNLASSNDEITTNRAPSTSANKCSYYAGLRDEYACANPQSTTRGVYAQLGDKRHCTCSTNCRKFTISCQRDGWHYSSNLCDALHFTHQEGNLIVSYNSPFYTFSCKRGYRLTGAFRVSCSNGQLQPEKPTCLPDVADGTQNSRSDSSFNAGSRPSDNSRSKKISTTRSNAWSTTTSNTPGIDLPTTSSARTTTAKPKMCSMQEADRICVEDIADAFPGYKTSCTCITNCRNFNLTCGYDGVWMHRSRENFCKVSDAPESFTEGKLTTIISNDVHSFECKEGYNLIGNEVAICRNGILSNKIPICQIGNKEVQSNTVTILVIAVVIFAISLVAMYVFYIYKKKSIIREKTKAASDVNAYFTIRLDDKEYDDVNLETGNEVEKKDENEYECIDDSLFVSHLDEPTSSHQGGNLAGETDMATYCNITSQIKPTIHYK